MIRSKYLPDPAVAAAFTAYAEAAKPSVGGWTMGVEMSGGWEWSRPGHPVGVYATPFYESDIEGVPFEVTSEDGALDASFTVPFVLSGDFARDLAAYRALVRAVLVSLGLPVDPE